MTTQTPAKQERRAIAPFAPFALTAKIYASIKDTMYRVRDGNRKTNCPHPDYKSAFIVMPAEWLGRHAIAKDRAAVATQDLGSRDAQDFAVSLAVLEDWGNIPGINDKNPEKWEIDLVPIPVMAWIIEAVLADFASAYTVPKA